jgi:hypothetical protein
MKITLLHGYYITNIGTKGKGKPCTLSYLWIGHAEHGCIGIIDEKNFAQLKKIIKQAERKAESK